MTQNQKGFSLLSTMVALVILGIVIEITYSFITNSIQMQKKVQQRGEKEDLKNIFRGSMTCESRCSDLLPSIPKSIGNWEIKPECDSKDQMILMVRNEKISKNWLDLFKDEHGAICTQVVHLPGEEAKQPRKQCDVGEVLTGVDFANKTIECSP